MVSVHKPKGKGKGVFGARASWRSHSVVKPDWCCVLRVLAKRKIKHRLVAVTLLDKKVVDFGNRPRFLKKHPFEKAPTRSLNDQSLV